MVSFKLRLEHWFTQEGLQLGVGHFSFSRSLDRNVCLEVKLTKQKDLGLINFSERVAHQYV